MADKVAVVTGGGHGIGNAIADAFRSIGVEVHIIDIKPGDWFVGDVQYYETDKMGITHHSNYIS